MLKTENGRHTAVRKRKNKFGKKIKNSLNLKFTA